MGKCSNDFQSDFFVSSLIKRLLLDFCSASLRPIGYPVLARIGVLCVVGDINVAVSRGVGETFGIARPFRHASASPDHVLADVHLVSCFVTQVKEPIQFAALKTIVKR